MSFVSVIIPVYNKEEFVRECLESVLNQTYKNLEIIMVNDIVSDSLTRIRNAALRRLDTTQLLHSKVVEAIVEIFVNEGYLESFNIVEDGNKKFINVVLKYNERGRSVINEVKKVSKPGRRVYQGKDEIRLFKNGYGTVVVSTSRGVMRGRDASKAGIGGEVLCTIW